MTTRVQFRETRGVALYTRVSSAEQVKGWSLTTQQAELCEWAEREGWGVFGVYEDAGISATSAEKRPAFMRMVADGEAGRFDAVLVSKFDRFARNRADSAIYGRRLGEAGVRVLSRQEPVDDGPSGFFVRGVHELFAEWYSIDLSTKVAKGRRTRALAGLPAGDMPFGYEANGREAPSIAEAEADALR